MMNEWQIFGSRLSGSSSARSFRQFVLELGMTAFERTMDARTWKMGIRLSNVKRRGS